MPGRTRTRIRAAVTAGKSRRWSSALGYHGQVNGFTGTSDHETCVDVTMSRPYNVDHELAITRARSNGPLKINGTTGWYSSSPTGSTICVFEDYNPADRSGYQYAPNIVPVNWDLWRTRALANMDPYAPVVDLPLFLFELREFPRMLQQAGLALKGQMGSGGPGGAYLSYHFGWAPLVRDLLSLFNLTKSIDDRIRYLRKLENGERFHRLLTNGELYSVVGSEYKSHILGYANGWAFRGMLRGTQHLKVWFSANGKLLVPLPNDGVALRQLSARMVTGLTWRPWDVWNAIPWSWLIGYLINVGDYLESMRGQSTFKATRMCIMATSTARLSIDSPTCAPGLSASVSVLEKTVKQRKVYANPTPKLTASPFLTGYQMSILGALVLAAPFRGARGA
jgi:hypothetical protein